MGLVVVANREPLRELDGRWTPSVGGLTSALFPVLEKRGGVWVAWGEKDAKEQPLLRYPADDPVVTVRRLAFKERELSNFYYGYANRVLWPLAHYFIERMDLRREYYEDYVKVNRRFARETLKHSGESDTIWVQDYQLMLVPLFLRSARPKAKIGLFWHIPWPALEVWRVLPQAKDLLEGMLGNDLIGFHVQEYVDNFLEAARVLLNAEVHGDRVHWKGRTIKVEPHPIGIDSQRFRHLSYQPDTRFESMRLRQEAKDMVVILGVDRLDYTKGILERLLCYERFLRSNPQFRRKVCFFQIATPSRTRVESYRLLKRQIDEVVGRINGSFMQQDWVPVTYLYRTLTHEQLAAYYRAADVALVTPLRDGMNLVAMEFVAANDGGVLVLSELAGASRVLPEALLVNPYDEDEVVAALKKACQMSARERYERLSALKKRVEHMDVSTWSHKFLSALEA